MDELTFKEIEKIEGFLGCQIITYKWNRYSNTNIKESKYVCLDQVRGFIWN